MDRYSRDRKKTGKRNGQMSRDKNVAAVNRIISNFFVNFHGKPQNCGSPLKSAIKHSRHGTGFFASNRWQTRSCSFILHSSLNRDIFVLIFEVVFKVCLRPLVILNPGIMTLFFLNKCSKLKTAADYEFRVYFP